VKQNSCIAKYRVFHIFRKGYLAFANELEKKLLLKAGD